MDKYGPLYHRNGAKILPSWIARTIIGVAAVLGLFELVSGIFTIAR